MIIELLRRALAPALFCLLVLGGCAQSRTFVLQQPAPGTVHSGLTLKPLESSVKVDSESQKLFESKLVAKLTKEVGVAPSDHGDLIVQYRFTLFDQGAGGARVANTLANIAGAPITGLGDGTVGVEVIYSHADGSPLGHIVTDGSIAGAFGSTSSALDDAAGSIAKYTKANFVCPSCGTVGIKMPTETRVKGLRPS